MDVRQLVDKGLLPLERHVTVSPNAITVIAFFVMVMAAGMMLQGRLVWAGVLIL